MVEFVGSQSGIEKRPRPQRRLRPPRPAPRRLSPETPWPTPAPAPSSSRPSHLYTHNTRPAARAVLGVGGYASAPAVAAARTSGLPTFLHEQNSVPGRVNRLASRFTTQTLVTFPAAGPSLRRAVRVGMPTGRELSVPRGRRHCASSAWSRRSSSSSAGAAGRSRSTSPRRRRSGARRLTRWSRSPAAGTSRGSQTENPRHRILEYVDDIWRYLAAADVVVSRAGAGSLFDIAAAGRAAILIPFPYATGDHQLHNARYFTEKGRPS